MSENRYLTDSEVASAVQASMQRSAERRQGPEPLSRSQIWVTRIAVGCAALGLTISTGVGSKLKHSFSDIESMIKSGNTPGRVADEPGVPKATMDYLKSLPTQRTEIPVGGGVDDAAYAVDPETFDESSDIRDGVEMIIADEVRPPGVGDGNFIVPAHAKVDVPVVPPIDQVPPSAR